MCSEKDGTNVPTPSSSPADSATEASWKRPRARPNAFDLAFLERLMELNEPPAAQEAEWAGPWLLDPSPDGDYVFYRLGESAEQGDQPWARFRNHSEALIAMAMLTCRREAAYRLSPTREALGYPVRSRPGWCETVAWLSVFDEDLVRGFAFLESLMRSPHALSYFLEACGGTVLERAGAILEERLRP